jgi:hypothetical protein
MHLKSVWKIDFDELVAATVFKKMQFAVFEKCLENMLNVHILPNIEIEIQSIAHHKFVLDRFKLLHCSCENNLTIY